jgi:hypothetical protein
MALSLDRGGMSRIYPAFKVHMDPIVALTVLRKKTEFMRVFRKIEPVQKNKPRETLGMALDSIVLFRSFYGVGNHHGVLTAIVIASLSRAAPKHRFTIEDYGTNNIYAFHLSTGPRTGEDRSERLRKPLTVPDAEAIKAQANAVEDLAVVAPNVGYSGGPFDDNITYHGHNYRWGNTEGVTSNYANIVNIS